MSRPAVVRVALAGPCAALSLSGCDSRSAIHQLAAVADGWSDSPKVIWPPPRTPGRKRRRIVRRRGCGAQLIRPRAGTTDRRWPVPAACSGDGSMIVRCASAARSAAAALAPSRTWRGVTPGDVAERARHVGLVRITPGPPPRGPAPGCRPRRRPRAGSGPAARRHPARRRASAGSRAPAAPAPRMLPRQFLDRGAGAGEQRHRRRRHAFGLPAQAPALAEARFEPPPEGTAALRAGWRVEQRAMQKRLGRRRDQRAQRQALVVQLIERISKRAQHAQRREQGHGHLALAARIEMHRTGTQGRDHDAQRPVVARCAAGQGLVAVSGDHVEIVREPEMRTTPPRPPRRSGISDARCGNGSAAASQRCATAKRLDAVS